MVFGRLGHARALVLLSLVGCPGSDDSAIDFTGTETTTSPTEGTVGPSTSGPQDSTGNSDACNADADCVGDPAGEICDLEQGTCGHPCRYQDTRPCYSGPAGTDGVGACAAGTNTCNAEGRWDLWCEGEVVPGAEDCANGIDDDCDGAVDDSDLDDDGYGQCSGDCCDIDGGGCSQAQLVNPGAYEVVGNELDDDCDGEIDEPPEACDVGLPSDTANAFHYARALDLCQTTAETPATPADRTWGVIDASLTMANGSGSPAQVQRALRPGFGTWVVPKHGDRVVVLSSGNAASEGDVAPPFAPFQSGTNLGTSSAAPADWLAANGGSFPNPPGCPGPASTNANDSVMLTLRMRAPTNASSFSVRTFFYSAEFPEYACTQYNDFFVTLVDSTADNPADKNLAIYDDGDAIWPVGVNLAVLANGLFTQCHNGMIGCEGPAPIMYAGCVGETLLEGTGFDLDAAGGCAPGVPVGGGTGWLQMSGNVTPGEVFEVRFAIWDSTGHLFDSLVLLDDWEWSVEAAEPGVAPG